jgi:hypothetical protein
VPRAAALCTAAGAGELPSAPDRVVSSKKSTHHWWVEFSHTATYN